MLNQFEQNKIDFSKIERHLEVVFNLLEKGICIYEENYKNSKAYVLEKDIWKPINENVRISTENYIECFLLNMYTLKDVYAYKSIYAMGNPNELKDEECKIAEILMTEAERPKANDIELDDDEDPDDYTSEMRISSPKLIEKLRRSSVLDIHRDKEGKWNPTSEEYYKRSGGLIDRLNIGLYFDIKLFDLVKEYEAEICKIIYFFYELERTPIISKLQGKQSKQDGQCEEKPYFNLITFLTYPSMESVDNSFSGQETYNGKITRFIKNKLEKEMFLQEMPLQEIENISSSLNSVATTWDKLLTDAREAVKTDKEFDFDKGNLALDSILDIPRKINGKWAVWEDVRHYNITEEELEDMFNGIGNTYQASPIASLYLIVSQFERLGEVIDKMWINDLEIEADYGEHPELIDRMKQYKDEPVVDSVEDFIERNYIELAGLVYPDRQPTENEEKSVLESKTEIPNLLNFCIRAKSLIHSEKEITKLLVISCLQAFLTDKDILTDKKGAEGYTFFNYQHHFKHNHQIKCDEYSVEAIKFYWARKVEDHWYANIGKFETCCKLREFESKLYEVLTKIYSCANVSKMKSRSDDYYGKLQQAGVTIDQ
jgi:hypothetical protein